MAKKGGDKEMQILEAAVRVFEEKGFNGATTREIAREAGVAEGTIFNYFPSKKDILKQILSKVIETFVPELAIRSLEQALIESKGKDPEEILRFVLHNRLKFVRQNITLLKIIMLEARFDPALREVYNNKIYQSVRKLLEQYIEEAIAAGFIRPLDVSVAATCFMGMFFGLLFFEPAIYAQGDADEYTNGIINKVVDIMLHGAGRGERS